MGSLVEELQSDALNSEVELGDLLRKAYTVATKLKLEKFRQWCEYELNGYPVGQELPDYRVMVGTLRAWNPYNGWIPVLFSQDSDTQDMLSTHKDRGPVATAQDLLRGGNKSGFYIVRLPPRTQEWIMRGTGMSLETSLHLGRPHLVRLLDTVRNTILEWSLKLEADDILGEGMSFNKKEKAVAAERSSELQSVVNYITIRNMTNSTIQQSSPQAQQTV